MKISDEQIDIMYRFATIKPIDFEAHLKASLIERLRIAERALQNATTPGNPHVEMDCQLEWAWSELIAEGKVRVQP